MHNEIERLTKLCQELNHLSPTFDTERDVQYFTVALKMLVDQIDERLNVYAEVNGVCRNG